MTENKNLTATLITVTGDSRVVLVVSPKTKTLRLVYRDVTERDLTVTELEYIDTLITQYELLDGYTLVTPIEC